MNILRNTFAVCAGLAATALIITLGIRLVPEWRTFESYSPLQHWARFLKTQQHSDGFFWFLLFISGLGTTIGGVLTAIMVKYAKVAYGILIGFITLFIAMLDVIIHPYYPTFFKILIFLVYFPFAWMGGKIVEVIYNKKKKRQASNKF